MRPYPEVDKLCCVVQNAPYTGGAAMLVIIPQLSDASFNQAEAARAASAIIASPGARFTGPLQCIALVQHRLISQGSGVSSRRKRLRGR